MGKFSHDGSNVDTSKGGGYDGEQPKPGIYPAKLVTCEEHEPAGGGDPGTHWVFEITDEPYAGWRGHVYTNDNGALWKQDQILVALGLQEAGGSYSGTHEAIVKKGLPVRVKTNQETYNDEKRGRIQVVLKGDPDAVAASPKAGKKKKKDDAEPF